MLEDLALAGGELVELGVDLRSAGSAPAKASSTKPARRGENTASPSATRRTASASSGPEIVLVTYPRAPARMTAMTSSGASETERARKRCVGPRLGHLADHLHPAAARHVHVEQDDVGLGARAIAGTALLDAVGVADDLDVPVELGAHAGAEQLRGRRR